MKLTLLAMAENNLNQIEPPNERKLCKRVADQSLVLSDDDIDSYNAEAVKSVQKSNLRSLSTDNSFGKIFHIV